MRVPTRTEISFREIQEFANEAVDGARAAFVVVLFDRETGKLYACGNTDDADKLSLAAGTALAYSSCVNEAPI